MPSGLELFLGVQLNNFLLFLFAILQPKICEAIGITKSCEWRKTFKVPGSGSTCYAATLLLVVFLIFFVLFVILVKVQWMYEITKTCNAEAKKTNLFRKTPSFPLHLDSSQANIIKVIYCQAQPGKLSSSFLSFLSFLSSFLSFLSFLSSFASGFKQTRWVLMLWKRCKQTHRSPSPLSSSWQAWTWLMATCNTSGLRSLRFSWQRKSKASNKARSALQGHPATSCTSHVLLRSSPFDHGLKTHQTAQFRMKIEAQSHWDGPKRMFAPQHPGCHTSPFPVERIKSNTDFSSKSFSPHR